MLKKSLFAFAVTAAFFIGITACGGNAEESTDVVPETEVEAEIESTHEGHDHATDTTTDATQMAAGVFACPMQCEGDKTYEVAGSCPVCGMDLVEKQ